MRRAPQWLLPVSAVFLLTGCATTLQLSRAKYPTNVATLRTQYAAEFPSSAYLGQISRGEVVKGMDRFGVLASWGRPDQRDSEKRDIETWTYVDTDEFSGDSVQYSLAFRAGVLDEWSMSRAVTGMTPVSTRTPDALPENNAPARGKRVPQR